MNFFRYFFFTKLIYFKITVYPFVYNAMKGLVIDSKIRNAAFFSKIFASYESCPLVLRMT